MNISLDDIEIEDPATSPRREDVRAVPVGSSASAKGMSLDEARRRLLQRQLLRLVHGRAAATPTRCVSGVNMHYPETIRPALEVDRRAPEGADS